MPVFSEVVNHLSWVVNGDIDALRGMLDSLTGIEKKRSQGYGKVSEWVITPIEASLGREYVWKRPIPIIDGIPFFGYTEQWYGYRAPYWHRDRQCRCWCPELNTLRVPQ